MLLQKNIVKKYLALLPDEQTQEAWKWVREPSLDPSQRRRRVMLDSDLAEQYKVETKNLKRAVRSNIERFPDDFMFELTKEEYESLRCKIFTLKTGDNVSRCENFTSKGGRGQHSKYLPFVFTADQRPLPQL